MIAPADRSTQGPDTALQTRQMSSHDTPINATAETSSVRASTRPAKAPSGLISVRTASAPRPRRRPSEGQSSSTSGSPGWTFCPACTGISVTTPSRGAGIAFSIFIASRMQTTSPAWIS